MTDNSDNLKLSTMYLDQKQTMFTTINSQHTLHHNMDSCLKNCQKAFVHCSTQVRKSFKFELHCVQDNKRRFQSTSQQEWLTCILGCCLSPQLVTTSINSFRGIHLWRWLIHLQRFNNHGWKTVISSRDCCDQINKLD